MFKKKNEIEWKLRSFASYIELAKQRYIYRQVLQIDIYSQGRPIVEIPAVLT